MKTDIIVLDPKEYGLETAQVATIEKAFLPKIQERDALTEIYNQILTSEITPDLCKQAKEIRLKAVKVRTGISDIHKSQKAFFLAAGRFVDAWKNKETLPVEQMEEKLLEVENYYINIEKQRIADLQVERTAEVSLLTPHFPADLGNMSDDVYSAYLSGLKVAYNARIEAEAKAEADRLAAIEADRLEQILIREENARLQAEAQEKEKQLQQERLAAKAEADKKAAEVAAQMKKQADALEAQRKESARIQAQKDAENARLQAELKAEADKKAALEKARIDAENAAKLEAAKAAKAPRKQKLQKWVDGFSIEAYENDATAWEITAKFEAFKKWATEQVSKL